MKPQQWQKKTAITIVCAGRKGANDKNYQLKNP